MSSEGTPRSSNCTAKPGSVKPCSIQSGKGLTISDEAREKKIEDQQNEPRGKVLNFKIDEGERLEVVTPNAGVLTLEGTFTALVMAVLELWFLVDALEVGGVTGVFARRCQKLRLETCKLSGVCRFSSSSINLEI
jgi:hypothetical protein